MTRTMKLGLGLFVGIAAAVVGPGARTSTAAAPSAAAAAWPPELDSVTGTITVHGCAVAPEDVLVRARPVTKPESLVLEAPSAADLTEIGRLPAAGNQSRVVPVRATTPGTFTFAFDGLAPLTPYRLGVKLLGQSRTRCAQVVWDVSTDPVILAGGTVSLVAHAVNSQLAVAGPAKDARRQAAWVAADTIDFDDPVDSLRQFRWRSMDPRANGGVVQVSTQPFPRVGARTGFDPCSEDRRALAYERPFDVAPGQTALIDINFGAVVNGGSRTSGALIDPGDGLPPAIDDNMRTLLEAGKPLYVRVVATVDGVKDCRPTGGVPAEVLLMKKVKKLIDQLGQPQFEIREVWYTGPFIGARPTSGETCYRLTTDHYVQWPLNGGSVWDMLVADHMSGVNYFQTASSTFPNNMFCVPAADDDDGWFESFVNDFGAVLTGLVDEIAKLVNAASEMWEDIQDYAVGAVAAGLDAIPGISCPPDPCQKALEVGLEVGLATMGVPPSLPNFDQLVDQGADYLAAQVASQVGVPSVVSDYASAEAQAFIKKAVKGMQDTPYNIPKLPDWLVPDIRFSPAVLTLSINRTTSLALPSRPGLIRDHSPIFAGRFVQLPATLPGPSQPSLKYPMVLEPTLDGLPAAPSSKCTAEFFKLLKAQAGAYFAAAACNVTEYEMAVWDKNKWTSLRFKNGCYHLRLTGLAPIGDQVFVLRDHYFRVEDLAPCQPVK